MSDKNISYKVYENDEIGNVFIADHVIEEITGIAVLEVEGLALDMDIREARKLVQKNISKVLPKKIRVNVEDDNVYIDIAINVIYGYDVVKVSKAVQDRVAAKINDMTGMEVREVNVTVNNIEALN